MKRLLQLLCQCLARTEEYGVWWGIALHVYQGLPVFMLEHSMHTRYQQWPEEDIDSTGMKLQMVESCCVGAEN